MKIEIKKAISLTLAIIFITFATVLVTILNEEDSASKVGLENSFNSNSVQVLEITNTKVENIDRDADSHSIPIEEEAVPMLRSSTSKDLSEKNARSKPEISESVDSLMTELDTDGDNFLSPLEFQGPQQMFQDIDFDSDGYLSRTELTRLAKKPDILPDFVQPLKSKGQSIDANKILDEMDHNTDGAISRAEFPGSDEAFFHADSDGNGRITVNEIR